MNASIIFKKLLFGVTASAGAYYITLAPSTLFLPLCLRLHSRFCGDEEIPVEDSIFQIFHEVQEDLKLSEDTKRLIRPFNVDTFDIFHAGTFASKYGAILGFPINFEFESLDTTAKNNLLLDNEPIDWSSDEGSELMTSLVLSRNAKKFAMAREILRIENNEPFLNSYSLAFIVMGLYASYSIAKHKLNLKEVQMRYRVAIQTCLALFGLGSWIAVKDYRSYNNDKKNDESLAQLGIDYVKGGTEFYNKLIRRNKVLRNLQGSLGKYTYTANGNENFFIRQRGMPLSHRKSFFELKLENVLQMV